MKHQTIEAGLLKTICWVNDAIVDYSSGVTYKLSGGTENCGHFYPFGDSCITSANGEYVFIYQKLGTKGLLLKNGELLREINRSYYCAQVYEYPAVFATIGGKTYLIHCPVTYKQLDFEDVETGELITNVPGRQPDDMFYSRLEISPDGTHLMSRGWVWHPLDRVVLFDLVKCLNNPKLLDKEHFYPDTGAEVCTADFIDNDVILIGTSDEPLNEEAENLTTKCIMLWDFKTDKLFTPVKVKGDFGNLFAIDSRRAWDLYCFPK